jgi:hypothetical protein
MSMQLLREDYSKNNVRLRILTPVDNQTMPIIEGIEKKFYPNLIYYSMK